MNTLPVDASESSARNPARSWLGSPSSMPASVAVRSPVHIFSTPTTSTGDSPPSAAIVPMWSADGSARTGIVDVDDPRALQTELPEPGLPTDGPLVREPAAERISHDDQTDLGGRDPRVAQGLRCRLYGESVWALVPTVQGRHGDPGDADRFSHEDHLAFVSRGA